MPWLQIGPGDDWVWISEERTDPDTVKEEEVEDRDTPIETEEDTETESDKENK